MKIVYIYTLSDPTSNEIRYIGQTNDMEDRLSRHLSTYNLQDTTKKNNWIVSLYQKGVVPLMELLDIGNSDIIDDLERYWIAQFRNWGFKLTNGTEGGDGFNWSGKKHKEESVMKMRINHPLRKCVGKFDKEGNLLDKYLSRHEAAKQTNIHRSHITRCCKGHQKTSGGFIWKYIPDFANEILIVDPVKIRNLDIKRPRSFKQRKTIIQYDLEGNILGRYNGISETNRLTGVHTNIINQCCKDKKYYTGKIKYSNERCTFRYENDPFDYKPHDRFHQLTNKYVGKFTKENKFIDYYDSINCAARENKIKQNTLSTLCKSPYKIDGTLRLRCGFNYRILSKEEIDNYSTLLESSIKA